MRTLSNWTTAAVHKLQEQRGTVSVFLIIIFASLLILAGLMIDGARILVAERKIDSALHSAARSVLADCDPVLAGQFGLYGVNHANKAAELERYLKSNLEERHEGFVFVDYRLEKAKLDAFPGEGLLNNEVFEQQILQYMKYKAPLRFTENVVQKFRQGAFSKKAQAGLQATETAKQSKVIRNKTVSLNKDIRKEGGSFLGGATDRLLELHSMQNKLAQITGELALYQQLADQSVEMLQEVEKATGELYDQLDINAEVRDMEEKAHNLTTNIFHNVKLMEEIKPIEEELVSLRAVEGEDAAARRLTLSSRFQELANRWQQLEEMELPTIEYTALKSKDVVTKKQLLQRINNLFGANMTSEEVLGALIGAKDFQEANQEPIKAEEVALDLTDPEADLVEMDLNNDLAETTGLALFQLIDKFAEGLEQAMIDGGKKLGICEYIMDKYTFATTRTTRGHYFELGEVEYILCGNNYELSNVGEMFVKIFVIRLAIASIDAFMKSSIPHPVARLGQALVRGFSTASLDMNKLYDGQSIALCPGVSQPTLTYSDHLRLFLLLQDKTTQLNRMRQLIQVDVRANNPEFSLQQHSGSFTAQVEVSVNLLFLPVLHLDKLGFKGFTPDRYIITKEAVARF